MYNERELRRDVNFDSRKTIIGTCVDMCPEFERHEREVLGMNGMSVFELVSFWFVFLPRHGTENNE